MAAKRKRRGGATCANPLFVRWVEELRDDAKQRDLKSHHGYTKVRSLMVCVVFASGDPLPTPQALNSLKKYPLPLSSGAEAKIIENVGMLISRQCFDGCKNFCTLLQVKKWLNFWTKNWPDTMQASPLLF